MLGTAFGLALQALAIKYLFVVVTVEVFHKWTCCSYSIPCRRYLPFTGMKQKR